MTNTMLDAYSTKTSAELSKMASMDLWTPMIMR